MDRIALALDPSAAPPTVTCALWLLTVAADPGAMTAFTVLAVTLLSVRGRARPAMVLAAAMALSTGAAQAIKALVARPRPPVSPLIAFPDTMSFPSGHTVAATVLFGCLAVFLVRSGAPRATRVAGAIGLVSIAVLVGASRVWLGVHWPTDVLAGWALGAAFVLGAAVLLRRWEGAGPIPTPAYRSGGLAWRRAVTSVAVVCAVWAYVAQALADPLLRR